MAQVEKNKWRPVDENALSDYVKRHLKSDLEHCGIVSLREVETRRGNAEPGERTDIYVIATIEGATPQSFNTVRVIVEAKGCWHSELRSAMETQLKNRYLAENDCKFGIYLVGWFASPQWDPKDNRKRQCPNWQFDIAVAFFKEQAERLCDDGCVLRSAVLDTKLR